MVGEKNYRSDSYFKNLYDCMQNFMGTATGILRNNKFIYHNQQLSIFLNLSKEEKPKLKNLVRLLSPEKWADITAKLSSENGNPSNAVQVDFQSHYNNEIKTLRIWVKQLSQVKHRDLYLIIQDITGETERKRKALQQQLRLTHDDRLSSLGTLSAGLAHELNQPLNAIRIIIGDLRFDLENGWPIEEKIFNDKLALVDKHAFQMSEIIRRINEFASNNPYEPAVIIDANEAIENVFAMLGQKFEMQNINIINRLSYEAMNVTAKVTQIEQIIINLIVNACDALEECDRHEKESWVSTEKEAGKIFIEVGDNATGVPESLKDKVFDPYFTTKDFGKGTGLGLSISRSIINGLNGHISVHNNELGGATFIVILPEANIMI